MTREEAIEFGNMWLQINEDCKDSLTYTFFQMALKALEQELVLDKLRDEIDLDTKVQVKHYTNTDAVIDAVLDVIDKHKAEQEKT